MKLDKIRKRNGEIVNFDVSRIFCAIQKATDATQKKITNPFIIPPNFIDFILDKVIQEIHSHFDDSSDKIPTVEDIQDIVEHILVDSDYFEIAKTYILYRAEHERIRAEKRIEELKKIEKNRFKITKHNGKKQLFDIKKIKKVFNIANKGFEERCKFNDLYEIFKNKLVEGMNLP